MIQVVGLGAALSGCVVESERGENENVRAEGGEFLPGSCVDRCGIQSYGECSCHADCARGNQCCFDYEDECLPDSADGDGDAGDEDPGVDTSDEIPGSCEGYCGDVSPDGCACTEECEGEGSCCGDYKEQCTEFPEPGDCTPVVVVTGYWPPTNEMLRQWSQNPEQNPGEWTGKDWRGLGYDVYSYFPEFLPDGIPFNDPFGSEGWVGSPEFDLPVDYQATSEDFWRIVDDKRPTILITTSRGGSIGWEVEAVEGGHHGPNDDPARDWSSDGHGDVTRPEKGTIDPRSWDAIETWRRGERLHTKLPVDEIVAAADALGLVSVEVDEGTSGNYLSGFMGLHGLAYAQWHPEVLAAGHIHVGSSVSNEDATALIEASLQAVLEYHPAMSQCPPE